MLNQLNAQRLRNSSLSTVTPPRASIDYSQTLADIAAPILYRSPLSSQADLPVYILNAAALPDANVVKFDNLLPYVLARLPNDEELVGGKGYEVVFFAGDGERNHSSPRKKRPGWQWVLRAYQVLTRAMRKRLQKLYLVHEKKWVKVTMEMFSSIASPKFRKKIFHVSSLSALALHIPIEDLLIPPSAYICDRRFAPDIYVPYVTGMRAFGVSTPLPMASTGKLRLPRVLRECTSFVLADENVKTEGLVRINARVVTVNFLKEAYDRGQKFIVWREGNSVLTFSHWKEGHGNVTVEDLQFADGYSLTTAMSLIKLWYADLREPIFPQSSYQFLERIFGVSTGSLQRSSLLDLISESSDWSPINKMSRQILTMHLLPLLAIIADHQDWNKMSPYNLSVCFAPALIHGPDAAEDVVIASLVARILEFAVLNWNLGLSAACGMSKWRFEDSLRLPENVEDREDPLDRVTSPSSAQNIQSVGIALIENDLTDSADNGESEEDKPSLPPRIPAALGNITDGDNENNRTSLLARSNIAQDGNGRPISTTLVKRKPAPTLQTPPRYSSIYVQGHREEEALPAYAYTSEGR